MIYTRVLQIIWYMSLGGCPMYIVQVERGSPCVLRKFSDVDKHAWNRCKSP